MKNSEELEKHLNEPHKRRDFEREEKLHRFVLSQVKRINERNRAILYEFDGRFGKTSLHRALEDNYISNKTYYASFINSDVRTDPDVITRIVLAIEVPRELVAWVFDMSSSYIWPFTSREKAVYELYNQCGFSVEILNSLLVERGFKPISIPSEKKAKSDRNYSRS